ncbi:hypothetical protein EAO24_24885 [Klebsiella pneumoniae]|nr:hypothetical protein EAO24_24885 [Klebsiella pneumoniae]
MTGTESGTACPAALRLRGPTVLSNRLIYRNRSPDKALAAIRHNDGNGVWYSLPGGAALARAYGVE